MSFQLMGSIVMAFVVLTASAYAKEGYSVNDVAAKMQRELHLTDPQVEAVKPIIKADLAKRQAFFESLEAEAVVNKSSVRTTLLKFKEEENQQLSQVLTKEQMKQLIEKQHLRESLNKDQVDFSEGLNGPSLTPQGGSMQF